MHPIFSKRENLIIYLAVAAIAATIPATSLAISTGLGFSRAIVVAIPPTLVYAFLGLAAWFPCRALPIGRSSSGTIFGAHALGAAAASGLWILLWQSWLERTRGSWLGVDGTPSFPMLFVVGVLLYLLAVAVYYVVLAVRASVEAEQDALRFQVLAREAELKAFKAQIDPHFLFNSLNSISSLAGSNPTAARKMTQQLGDFFRRSLRVGGRERIPLGEELDLVSLYLSIEQVRFGERLSWNIDVAPSTKDLAIPPLLLQPLVENAVRHGIAGLVDGGVVKISSTADDDNAILSIENDCDPDHRATAGEGIGIENVRGRIETIWRGEAKMIVKKSDTKFAVEIRIPRERQ